MSAIHRRLAGVLALLLLAPAPPAAAWPARLSELLGRDARRLLPLSLARLISEREQPVLELSQRLSPALAQRMASDLPAGRLSPELLAELSRQIDQVVELLRGQRAGEGLVRLGALLRIPADLSDPVLAAGAAGLPPGVASEYYALVEARLERIPVVIDDPASLELRRDELPRYWQRLLDRGRPQAAVIRAELFRNGRVVDQSRIDFRNPAFGVASMSYSRAVTAIAATWLAVWREAGGDLTRKPSPRRVEPRARGRAPAPPGGQG